MIQTKHVYPNILVGFVLPAPSLFVPSFLVLRLFVQALRITTFPDTITHSTPPLPFFVNTTFSQISSFHLFCFLLPVLPVLRSFIIITLLEHCTEWVYTSGPSTRHASNRSGWFDISHVRFHYQDTFPNRSIPDTICPDHHPIFDTKVLFQYLVSVICENCTTKTDNNRLITIQQFNSNQIKSNQ